MSVPTKITVAGVDYPLPASGTRDWAGTIGEALVALSEAPNGGFGVFNAADYGAVGDGVTNDRPAIQAAIDAAQALGAGIVTAPAGHTYLLNSGLTMSADQMVLDFRGSILKAGASMDAMLTLAPNGSRAADRQQVLGGIWNCNSLADKALLVQGGWNLRVEDFYAYAPVGDGIYCDGGHPATDYRFLSVHFKNCRAQYAGGAGIHLEGKGNTGSFTGFHFADCALEQGAYGLKLQDCGQVTLQNCEVQANSTFGLYAKNCIVDAAAFYAENGAGKNTYATSGAELRGKLNNFGDIVFGDSTSMADAQNYVSALGYNFLRSGTLNKVADNLVVGSPAWPAAASKSPVLSGHVAVAGQTWVDICGVEWICTLGGNSATTARWAPKHGRVIWPFDYTMLSNGALFWWALDEYLITSMRLFVLQTFLHGSATPALSFGDGAVGQEWFSEAQLAYANLIAGAVINAKDNAAGTARLASGAGTYLAGKGPASGSAGTSSIRQYANPTTAGWTQGKGYLLIEGVNLLNQGSIVYR